MRATTPPPPPLISVVIPAYNAAPHLQETLATVQGQTLTAWELLVIDDGSTDATAAIAAAAAHQDPRIRLISVVNGGVSCARNIGVAASRAPLVAFLDADDRWSPQALASHRQHFQRDPGLGVSFARVELLRPDGQPTGKVCRTPLSPLTARALLAENLTITTSNWVVRRDLFDRIGGFLNDLNHCEDLEWLLRLRCCTDWRIQAVDQVLTYYRTSAGGLSSQLRKMEEGWHRMADRVARHSPELVRREGPHALAVQLRYLALRALRLGLPAGLALDCLVRSVRSDWTIVVLQPGATTALVLQLILRLLHRPAPSSS